MYHLSPPCISAKLPLMENNKPSSSELTPSSLGFPTEFPYEFDSPTYSPGFTSPGDSTETEDESSDDEEGFLAGLTRRLAPSTHRQPPPPPTPKTVEKLQLGATSPQSTLSRLGSFSNSGSQSPILPNPPLPPLPPMTHRRDNAYDVISAAAGEVAKLKMGSYETHRPCQNHNSYLSRQNQDCLLRRQNAAFQSLQQQIWLCSQARVIAEEVAFENLRLMRLNALSTSTWLAGTPLKRPSTGTGVFLPRRYPTTTSPSCVGGGGLKQERSLPHDWMY